MVNDTVDKLYGHLDGIPYSFDESSLLSLQQGVESFIETMWRQIKEIMREENRQIIEKHDFDVWKRNTGFKLRVKSRRESLCDLFDQVQKQKRRRIR